MVLDDRVVLTMEEWWRFSHPSGVSSALAQERRPDPGECRRAVVDLVGEAVYWAHGALATEDAWKALLLVVETANTIAREDFDAAPAGRPSIPAWVRKAVLERDAYRCQKCDDWHDLTVDHILPVVLGGATSLSNLQTLCRSCNSSKGARI